MINSEENKLSVNTNAVALKLFRHIANEWQLPAEQSRKLFPSLEDEQFEDWMSGNLNSEQPDLLVLVSHLMAIYKLLHQIFPKPVQANAWILKPNSELQNFSGFELIIRQHSEGAKVVRSYLEGRVT
ncbi:hypothetical protein [Rheinheimera gaetbuli]